MFDPGCILKIGHNLVFFATHRDHYVLLSAVWLGEPVERFTLEYGIKTMIPWHGGLNWRSRSKILSIESVLDSAWDNEEVWYSYSRPDKIDASLVRNNEVDGKRLDTTCLFWPILCIIWYPWPDLWKLNRPISSYPRISGENINVQTKDIFCFKLLFSETLVLCHYFHTFYGFLTRDP